MNTFRRLLRTLAAASGLLPLAIIIVSSPKGNPSDDWVGETHLAVELLVNVSLGVEIGLLSVAWFEGVSLRSSLNEGERKMGKGMRYRKKLELRTHN